jgi:hypothetical protein
MTKRISICLALCATLALGCGTEGGSPPADDHHHSGDGEHDHYAPGMQRESADGLYFISFYSDPAPPGVGANVFTLGLTDSAGAAVEGALISVDPTMPGHGHGSDRVPVVEEDGAGIYRVTNVSLQMLGIWQIDISIEGEAGTDTVAFRFDAQ